MEVNGKNPNVDGGWAWFVLFGAFGQILLVIGTFKSFGLFFVEYEKAYDTTASVVSIAQSVKTAVFSFGGFFVMTLGYKRFSGRQMMMAAGFFSALAFFLNALIPGVPVLILSQGVFCGLGSALCYGPALAAVQTYFKKRIGLAISLANSGAGVGTLVIPMVVRHLLDKYGLNGALTIMAGIVSNMIALAALMKPLQQQRYKTDKDKQVTIALKENSVQDVKESLVKNNDVDVSVNESNDQEDTEINARNSDLNNSVHSPMLPEKTTEDTIGEIEEQNRHKITCKPCHKFFDPKILLNHRFQLIIVAGFLISNGSLLVIPFIPPFAKDQNLTKDQSALLVTISGVCDFVSRIILAFVADTETLSRSQMVGICGLVTGIATMLNHLFSTFLWFVAYVILYGLFGAVYYALYPVLISDAIGRRNQRDGLAVMFIVHGISLMVNSFLNGYLKDVTGTYHASFYLMGACYLLGAAILFCEPIVRKLEKPNSKSSKNNES